MYFYDNSGMVGYFKALPHLHASTNSMQTWLKMVLMQYTIKLNSLNHCTYWLNTLRSKACQHIQNCIAFLLQSLIFMNMQL